MDIASASAYCSALLVNSLSRRARWCFRTTYAESIPLVIKSDCLTNALDMSTPRSDGDYVTYGSWLMIAAGALAARALSAGIRAPYGRRARHHGLLLS